MSKIEQITDARQPMSLIETTRGMIPWSMWIREQKDILDAGSWYRKGTVSVESHGSGIIALWGIPNRIVS